MTPTNRPGAVVRLISALAVVIAVGVLSRLYPLGYFLFDKSLGDVLYAAAAYLALALALYRFRPAAVAPTALAACVAVECFKLTGLPARYARLAAVRWLLGTSFAWHNLACYAAGVAAVAALDALLLRPQSGKASIAKLPKGEG